MLLNEFPNWPPIVSGVGTGYDFPRDMDVMKGIYPANDKLVTFGSTYEGHEFRRHFKAENAELAEKLTELLSRNVGKSVRDLGKIEIDLTVG